MKKQSFISILMFALCFLVFISSSLAWFSLEEKNDSHGAIINIEGIKVDASLEYWNGTDWEEIDDVILSNFNPGDTKYFRVVVTNVNGHLVSFNMNIDKYESKPSNEIKVLEDNVYTVDNMNNNIILHHINEDRLVIVEEDKVLYDCTNGFKLDYYKIENVLTINHIETKPSPLGIEYTIDDYINHDAGDGELESLSSFIGGTISLNSYESTNIVFSINFQSTSDDSYYQFQNFYVNGISINIV